MKNITLGLSFVLLAGVAACGAPAGDAPLEKTGSGTGAQFGLPVQFAPARVNCQNAPITKVVAHPTYGSYTHSVQELVNQLRTSCTMSNPRDCADQAAYTSAIYGIPGAAGYYYTVTDAIWIADPTPNPAVVNGHWETADWIAIPITDSTTTSPSYYATHPDPSFIHTPGSSGVGRPQFGNFLALCDGEAGCYRRDHYAMWSVVQGTGNTAAVGGRVRQTDGSVAAACVEIVDAYGNFLDFSAELEEHDPNGCANCKK